MPDTLESRSGSTKPLVFEGIPKQFEIEYRNRFAEVTTEVIALAQNIQQALPEIKKSLSPREKQADQAESAKLFLEALFEQRRMLQTIEDELITTFPLEDQKQLISFFPEVTETKNQIAALARMLYVSYPLLRFTGYEADHCTELMLGCHGLELKPSTRPNEHRPPAPEGLRNDLRNDGYYIVPSDRRLPPLSWYSIQKKTEEDPDVQLSPEEFDELQTGQDMTKKLHLQVPRSLYRQTVAAVVEHIHGLGENEIFWKWKFRPMEWIDLHSKDQHKRFPIFVFYSFDDSAEGPIGDFQGQIEEVHKALQEHQLYLPNDSPPPRFSTQLEIGGQPLAGFFIAQGDGDHKIWLDRRGLLDQYYDSQKDYALRKEPKDAH